MNLLSARLLLSVGLVSLLTSVAFAGPQAWKLTVEGGSEYDSNPHRVDVVENPEGASSAGLLRTGARLQMRWKPAKNQSITVDARGASKVFSTQDGQSENIGIVYFDGQYNRKLGSRASVLGLRGTYYDAIDIRPFGDAELSRSGRSFRTASLESSLALPSESEHRIRILAGVRSFSYKPDADFDWQGAELGVRYATVFWRGDPDEEGASSVDLRGGYQVGLRSYQGAAFRNTCPPGQMASPQCFVPTAQKRSDLHHALVGEVVYTGKQIYSLLYGAQINDSNSYGQSSIRQRLELSMTTELPAGIFLTASAVLRLNTFLDPLLLARDVESQSFVSIEDESRNALQFHFARDLSEHLGMEARLSMYRNEFATEELRFRRQTAYLGVVYRFEKEPRLR